MHSRSTWTVGFRVSNFELLQRFFTYDQLAGDRDINSGDIAQCTQLASGLRGAELDARCAVVTDRVERGRDRSGAAYSPVLIILASS